MNYEAAVISKILKDNLIEEALDLAVSKELFHEYIREWDFIMGMYINHSGIPSTDLLEDTFKDFKPIVAEEPLSFLVEELKTRHIHSVVMDTMREQADALKSEDPYTAIEAMRKAIAEAEDSVRTIKDINVAQDPEARIEEYRNIIENEGITGIRSPWDILDRETCGFQSEDLVMIAARGGVGKTWCEVVLAEFLRNNKYKTVVFSKEMSVTQIIRRFDAVASKISFSRFKSGQLTTAEFERFKTTMAEMKGTTPMWVSGDIDAKMGVSSVAAKMDKYRPDMVLIDGVYMMRDERNSQKSWEKFTNICEDLKSLAQRKKIPIVVTHQFNLSGKDDNGDADTLKYGDVQMWFDLIIGMYQTEDLRANNEMLFKVNKIREGIPVQWVSSWDLDKMSFEVKNEGRDDVGEYEYKEGEDSESDFDDVVPF